MAHKLYLFVPGYGQHITATTFLTSHQIVQHCMARGIQVGLSTLSFPDIAELRNMALTIWYDRVDASHILFVDSDMGFAPELVVEMLMHDEPVVGAIYPQRQLPTSWAGSGTGEEMATRRGDFMKVEGVGMGCCLIRRDAIDRMLSLMPQIVDTRLNLHPAQAILKTAGVARMIRAFDKLDIPQRGVVSEDLSFCIRHNQCGGEVWAAIGHRISHVGPFDYGHRYLDLTSFQLHTASRTLEGAPSPAPLPAALVHDKALLIGRTTAEAEPIKQAPKPDEPEQQLEAAE